MTSRAVRGFLVMGAVCALVTIAPALAQAPVRQTNIQALNKLSNNLAVRFEREHAAALLWAAQNGIGPLRVERRDGTIIELMYVRDGRPVYYITGNSDAADTVSTDEIQVGGSSGLDLDGTGVLLHVWDAGHVRTTHQEVSGRVASKDGGGIASHSTHVGCTMIATGLNAQAHGMANNATLDSYNWSSDEAEMAAAAAVGALVSNHSYGIAAGWTWSGSDWYWYGDVAVSAIEDPVFGLYGSAARNWDRIAFDAPFYLIVQSAGNERDDSGPTSGTFHWHWDGVSVSWEWSDDSHPADGGATGYDTMTIKTNAKNILSVGAVRDITGGYAGPGSVVLATFSSWGPTDDGRIKPDIVANGLSLYSCNSGSDTDYTRMGGTSMSAPNAAGSLGLLIQHYRATHGLADMRSATLKGLVIHTADEAGAATGPDYSYGWGLLNSQSAAEHIEHDVANPETIQELTIAQGQTIEQVVAYNGSGPFKATICWTDPPGTPAPYVVDPPDRKLINDLDLRVIGPAGTALPWILDPANPAGPATTGDNDRDNMESVLIGVPASGDYTVRITHKGTLANAPQDFSLILTGTGLNVTTGACCQSDGAVCTDETAAGCLALGGSYQLGGNVCLGDNDDNGLDDACQPPPEAKFSQPPEGEGEDVASNIDSDDMVPSVVVADDFVSDGRPITAVRWWGSKLGPACDDNVVNQLGEECDGTDDSACPGRCRADCTCGAGGGSALDDDMESYANGSNIHGQGGWKGWDNNPGAGALITQARNHTTGGQQAVDIVGASDLVYPFSDLYSRVWNLTAWQYVPSALNAPSGHFFIVQKEYNDGGPYQWSIQMWIANDGTVHCDCGGSDNGTPGVLWNPDAWNLIEAEIDLDSDWVTLSYNGTLLGAYQWTTGTSGADFGCPAGGCIGAIDLFANGGSSVYYDDLELTVKVPPLAAGEVICGDNVVNQGSEECDGTDDGACPGQCLPNCTCAPPPAPEPDGWFISFHEMPLGVDSQLPPLALYFCDANVVDSAPTVLPVCDGHPVIKYLVDLPDCCLVQANPDSRSGWLGATKGAFLEEKCFDYAIDIQAVVGHRFEQDPVTFECIETPTGISADDDFWGWHTTSLVCGRTPFGPHDAATGSVKMGVADQWLYGPWSPVTPVCSLANMAFELVTSITMGDGDTNGNCVPDQCECFFSSQPEAEQLEGEVSAKNRYLSVELGDPGRSQAIRVTFAGLPSRFDGWEGMQFFVSEPFQVCENSGQDESAYPACGAAGDVAQNWFWAARLLCEKNAAYFMDWHGECIGGTCVGGLKGGAECSVDDDCVDVVHIFSEGIVPSKMALPVGPITEPAVYEIQVIDSTCEDLNEEADYSPPLSMTQSGWGDVCGPGDAGACTGVSDGVVDVQNDVLGVLDKFANVNAMQKARADIEPGDDGIHNGPDLKVTVANDVLYTLEAFGGAQYPFWPGNPCEPD